MMNINNSLFLIFSKINASASVLLNKIAHIGNSDKVYSKDIDHIDIKLNSLLKSRALAFNNDFAVNIQSTQKNTAQTVPTDFSYIEIGKTIPKPAGVDIDDAKRGVLVAIANDKGITDPGKTANLALSDISLSEIRAASPFGGGLPRFYVPENSDINNIDTESIGNFVLSDSGLSMSENTPSKRELQNDPRYLLTGLKGNDVSTSGFFAGDSRIFLGEQVYTYNPQIAYDAKLADVDIDTLISLHKEIKNDDIIKVKTIVNDIFKSSVATRAIVKEGGEKHITPEVDRDALIYYFNKGMENTEKTVRNRYQQGLLSELGEMSGGNSEKLFQFTLGDLSEYIDKSQGFEAVEINGFSNIQKDYDTLLTSLSSCSLYCIVEGIKQDTVQPPNNDPSIRVSML